MPQPTMSPSPCASPLTPAPFDDAAAAAAGGPSGTGVGEPATASSPAAVAGGVLVAPLMYRCGPYTITTCRLMLAVIS